MVLDVLIMNFIFLISGRRYHALRYEKKQYFVNHYNDIIYGTNDTKLKKFNYKIIFIEETNDAVKFDNLWYKPDKIYEITASCKFKTFISDASKHGCVKALNWFMNSGFKLLERIYTFKSRDDEDNLCCSNISCKTYSDEIILFDVARKVKYFCIECGRTLLFENNKIFGSESLADGWLYLNGYGDKNDKNVKCSKCEDYVLRYQNYKNCDFCGKIYKGECYHETLKFVDFVKNENNEKCAYCDRYLIKCKLCDNACYVCVFVDCFKSQKTGNSIESYFGLCETCMNDNTSLKKHVRTSNVQCDNCGLKKYWRKADCIHVNDALVCNNCDGDRLICCYDCY